MLGAAAPRAAELIKRVEQWLLIQLVYTQIWHSFTCIKLPLTCRQVRHAAPSSPALKRWSAVLCWCLVLFCYVFSFFCLSSSLRLPHTSRVLPEGSSDLAFSFSQKKFISAPWTIRSGNGAFECESHIVLFGFLGREVEVETGSLCSWGRNQPPLRPTPPTPPPRRDRSGSPLPGKGLCTPHPSTLQRQPPSLLPTCTPQWQTQRFMKLHWSKGRATR